MKGDNLMTEPSQEDVQATHRGIVEALEQAIACVKAENALRAVVSRKRLFGTMMSPEVRAQVNTEIGIRGSTFLRIHVAARLAFDSASDAFSKFGEKLKSILPSIPSAHFSCATGSP